MLKRLVFVAVTVGLVSACSSSPKPGSVTEHKAALAKVATLTAQADANPMLAPWGGPYGGVPPWDAVKADLFPGAFDLGLTLLLAEIDVVAE